MARGRVDLGQRALELVARLHQVRALRGEEIEALQLLGVLLNRERVDRPHTLQLLGEAFRLLPQQVGVAIHVLGGGEQLRDGAVPLRLGALDQCLAAAGQLRVLDLGPVPRRGRRERVRAAATACSAAASAASANATSASAARAARSSSVP
jgi:hypothetical protein